jgi:hypothetical protein
MELLGDVGHVKARFGPFGDSANLTQDMCMVAQNVPEARKSFWTHPMELQGVGGHGITFKSVWRQL